MNSTLEVAVAARRLPLSKGARSAIRHLERYDYIVFTSKKARDFFNESVREEMARPPLPRQVISVGPRAKLLKIPLRGKRILFPRSARAPHDIVRKMRARSAVVRVIRLYTVFGVPLSKAQTRALRAGRIKRLYFQSPSGIDGLVRQIPLGERTKVLALPALCIGETTARAAREAGFKQVSIKNV